MNAPTTPLLWPKRRHGDLESLAPNVWRVEGPVPGLPMLRQMIIARDSLGRLLLHSAIALDAPRMSALEALGSPHWLVVPNGHHRLDAPAYKARFSRLIVVAPDGARARVAKAVPVDLAYNDFPEHPELTLAAAPWPAAQEGVVEIRSGGELTIVFNDLIFNPPVHGIGGVIYRLLGRGPEVPWLAQRMYAPDRPRLRDWLLALSKRDGLSRIVPGHGPPIVRDAATTLRCIALAV